MLSDMDSYEDMKLKDGVPYYASKKITASENKKRKKSKLFPLEVPIYVPVKKKNMASVFLTVERSRIPNKNAGSVKEFVTLNELF